MEAEAGAGAGAGVGAQLERLHVPAEVAVGASDGDRQVWAAKGALYSVVYVLLERFERHWGYSQIRAGDGRDGRDRQVGQRKREDERGYTLVGQRRLRRLRRCLYRTGSLGASHSSSLKQQTNVGGFKVREASAGEWRESGGRVEIQVRYRLDKASEPAGKP